MKVLRAAVCALACVSSVHAVSPVIWEQNTQEEFSKGETENLTVTRDGEVRLGPNLEVFADMRRSSSGRLPKDPVAICLRGPDQRARCSG